MESVARNYGLRVSALTFDHIICRIPEQISKKELDNLPNGILAEDQKLKVKVTVMTFIIIAVWLRHTVGLYTVYIDGCY